MAPFSSKRTNISYFQTDNPSLQLAQMSIFLRLEVISWRNCLYFLFCQISLNDSFFKFPNLWVASLSKQHGTTIPSQVITFACHSFQQWFCNLFLAVCFPSLFFL